MEDCALYSGKLDILYEKAACPDVEEFVSFVPFFTKDCHMQ
jgi:hypothetical protein